MPFNFTNKSAGDLIQSQDWNAAMVAIKALYDLLDASTGHAHTGGPEDGPQLGSNGIQDAAITLQKLANFAVDSTKLANGAVDSSKLGTNSVNATHIQTNAVGASEIANGAVGNAEIANLAVTNSKLGTSSVSNSKLGTNSVTGIKIANGTITAAKLANGVAPALGIATSSLSHGQTAPIPSGFLRSECRYIAALRWINFNVGGTGVLNKWVNINQNTGEVTLGTSSALNANAAVMTLAKKGGW